MLSEEQIEAEVARVSALARKHLKTLTEDMSENDMEDPNFNVWVVACMVTARDDEEEEREHVTATYETSSRVLQIGIATRLYDGVREQFV
jgi:hypothetical protein